MFNLSADRAIHSFSANMENEEGCFEVVYGVGGGCEGGASLGRFFGWRFWGGDGSSGGASLGRFFVMGSLRARWAAP